MVEERDNVVAKRVDVVGALRLGLAIPSQVRRDHAKAGVHERRDLVAPRPPHLGKPVQEDDEGALALLDVVHPNAVHVGVLVADSQRLGRHGFGVSWKCTPRRESAASWQHRKPVS